MSDQLDPRLAEDTFSILSLSWLSSLTDWFDFQPTHNTCKITPQLAHTFQSKFSQNDRLISLKALALLDRQIYPKLRLEIFSRCLKAQEISSRLVALQVFPLMQFHLETNSFLMIFYSNYCQTNLDERLKSSVMNIWRTHRCLFDQNIETIVLKVNEISLDSIDLVFICFSI